VIARLKGTLLTRTPEGTVELETPAGIVYEVDVPLTVLQRLPVPPAAVELRTVQVVREDSVALYGFIDRGERDLFRRLLDAPGVGARLALSMMSTYPAPRLARALVEKDVNALKQVSGVGRKTAEKLVLELSDKVADLAFVAAAAEESGTTPREAVAALVALGYSFADADVAVRLVLENGGAASVEELVRKALARR
jgi:Holliday junction DNA helicase RuvA